MHPDGANRYARGDDAVSQAPGRSGARIHNGNGGPVNPSNLPPAAFVRPASQEGEAGACSLPRPTADLRHPTLLAEHLPSKCVQELPRHAATARLFTCHQVTPSTDDHAARATEDTLP